MTRRLALALCLVAAAAAAGPARAAAGGPVSSPPADLDEAVRRLLDEDVATTAAVIEGAAAARPGDPAARFALGLLRFYQQRYDEAVPLLEQDPGAHGGDGGFLRLARNAAALGARQATAESDHFVVAYPKGKDEILAPDLLATLEAQRAALFADLGPVPWPAKVRVEVLDGVADLSRLSTLTDAEIRGSGTIALCKYGKLMMVSPKALVTGYDWLDTAAHELVHLVVARRAGGRAPIWLHEGIAKWFESRWRGAGGEDFSPTSAALVRRAVEGGTLVTFDEMHPSMAKLPTQEKAALAYAEVVLAVELLVKRGGMAAVAQVLDGIAGGAGADAAVASAMQTSWPGFQAAWKQHLASRPLPKGGAAALRTLRFQDDPKQVGPWVEWAELPDQASRDHARLGAIMRERGRWTAARLEYGKAIARAGAKVAILATQFAVAAVRSGRPAEAEKVLGEALGWNPDSASLHVQLARLQLEKKDFAAARGHLVEANRHDPFDPEIHLGLAACADAQGDAGGASRERRFTSILKGEKGEGHP